MSLWRFLQDWGLVPAWGLFFLVLVALIKAWPSLQKNSLEHKENRESRYSKRISELEQAVRDCQRECEDHKDELRKEVLGMRRQHLQEQISLVMIIMDSVDNPTLKQLLARLQSTQRSYGLEPLGEVVGDAAQTPK